MYATHWEKIFVKDVSDKDLYPEYIKNSYNNIKQTFKEMGKRHEQTLHEGKYTNGQ